MHQEPRNFNTVDFEVLCDITNDLNELCLEAGISMDQAIRIYELAELRRRNNLYVINGDIHDEQMAGFGEILNEMLNIVRTLPL